MVGWLVGCPPKNLFLKLLNTKSIRPQFTRRLSPLPSPRYANGHSGGAKLLEGEAVWVWAWAFRTSLRVGGFHFAREYMAPMWAYAFRSNVCVCCFGQKNNQKQPDFRVARTTICYSQTSTLYHQRGNHTTKYLANLQQSKPVNDERMTTKNDKVWTNHKR